MWEKITPEILHLLIQCATTIICIAFIGAAACFIIVGKTAYGASSPSAAGSFGLLLLAIPSISTIVLIVLATAALTAADLIKPEGCVAIFSSIASFVLGAESQKRRDKKPTPTNGTPGKPGATIKPPGP